MKCPKCSAEWNASVEVEKCPFCQADLTQKETIEIVKEIVKENSLEIYNKPEEFKQKLSEKLGKDNIDYKRLAILIDNGASVMFYETKELDSEGFKENIDEFEREFNDMIGIYPFYSYMNILREVLREDEKYIYFYRIKARHIYPDLISYSLKDRVLIDGILYGITKVWSFECSDIVPAYEVVRLVDENIVDVVIRREIDGIPVSIIASEAFYRAEKLESIKIFNDEIEIEYDAFKFCQNLKEVKVVDGKIKKIGDGSFFACLNLRDIDLSSCREIGDEAFFACEKLKYIDLLSCKTIGRRAFYCCYSIVTIELGESLNLKERAFEACKNLTKVYFKQDENGNLSYSMRLKENVFGRCENLKEVYLPQNLITIESGVFNSCESLSLVTFSKNTGYYSSTAFNISFDDDEIRARFSIPSNWKVFSEVN